VTKRIKTVAIVVVAAAYPFLGTYFIRNGWGDFVLVLFAALTLWRGLRARRADIRFVCILGAALLLAGAYFGEASTVRLIPAFVYLSLAFLFGHTLWHPPSLCERLVRLQYPEFKPGIAEYLRQVTWVWAGFFAVNTVICALLPVFADDWVWTLYTGVVVYVLMAFLAVGEYFYRLRLFPDLEIPPLMETLRVMMRQGHRVFKDTD
jgi:uncharacterized membrane protein